MKVFGGSILSHYSRWCPVQARLVQSPETKWEGREREKSWRGERCWVLSTSPSLSQLFTPQRLFFRERSDQFILSTQKCTHATHIHSVSPVSESRVCPRDASQLKTRGRPKLHWFFMGLGALKLIYAGATMDLSNHIHASTHTDLPPGSLTGATLAPGRPGTLPSCSSPPLPQYTHTNPLPPLSTVQLIPTWSQFMGEEEAFWLELTPERWERENICHRSS